MEIMYEKLSWFYVVDATLNARRFLVKLCRNVKSCLAPNVTVAGSGNNKSLPFQRFCPFETVAYIVYFWHKLTK